MYFYIALLSIASAGTKTNIVVVVVLVALLLLRRLIIEVTSDTERR